MINEFRYGQTWKIWPSPLSLSLSSTLKCLIKLSNLPRLLFLLFVRTGWSVFKTRPVSYQPSFLCFRCFFKIIQKLGIFKTMIFLYSQYIQRANNRWEITFMTRWHNKLAELSQLGYGTSRLPYSRPLLHFYFRIVINSQYHVYRQFLLFDSIV